MPCFAKPTNTRTNFKHTWFVQDIWGGWRAWFFSPVFKKNNEFFLTFQRYTLLYTLIYSQSCTTITTISEHFYHPGKKFYTNLPFTPRFFLSPTQPLIYFLSIHSCLFWRLHINGIIYSVGLCYWPLSLIVVCLRFIHILEWIGNSFLCLLDERNSKNSFLFITE